MDTDPDLETLRAEHARLEARLASLNAEIRAYPQPIARCDAQLGGLVEERIAMRARLVEIDEQLAGRDRRL